MRRLHVALPCHTTPQADLVPLPLRHSAASVVKSASLTVPARPPAGRGGALRPAASRATRSATVRPNARAPFDLVAGGRALTPSLPYVRQAFATSTPVSKRTPTTNGARSSRARSCAPRPTRAPVPSSDLRASAAPPFTHGPLSRLDAALRISRTPVPRIAANLT